MNGISELVNTIAKFAPLLANVLPIPGAGIIGQVIASAFGGDINKPTELAEMIEKDPNSAVKLAEIQANMKVQLEQIASTNLSNQLIAEKVRLETTTAQLESDRLDRANARELGKLSNMPAIVSFIILIGFFVLVCIILFFPLGNQESNVMFLLLGTIASAFASVVAYWLGSSAGSKAKDSGILDQANIAITSNQQSDFIKAQAQAEATKTQAQTAQTTAETAKTTAETAKIAAEKTDN